MTADLGTENGIATTLHQMFQTYVPDLLETNVWLHHKSARNQRAEMMMGLMKEQCTGVFIRLFKSLEQRGLFIAHDPIDSPCLYVVFHPILVRELSEFTTLHNGHRIRKQQGAE